MPQAKFVADNILKFLFIIIYFSEKISLDISCEASAWLMIHLKINVKTLFFEKLKVKLFSAAADWHFKDISFSAAHLYIS